MARLRSVAMKLRSQRSATLRYELREIWNAGIIALLHREVVQPLSATLTSLKRTNP